MNIILLDICAYFVYYTKYKRSPVAQLVERVAVNHLVGSSSLSRGAISTQKGH